MSLLDKLIGTRPWQADVGLVIIRVWFGLVMAFGHGWDKAMNAAGFAENVAKMGLPAAGVLAYGAIASELLGGILLAVGLLTRAAGAMLLVTMLVAAFVVHSADPFAKKEFALAYAAAALALTISGAGRYSLDHRWSAKG